MPLTRPKFIGIDSSVVNIKDPIPVVHYGASINNVDIGLLLNRANGLVSNAAIYWSESSTSFILALTANSGQTDTNITVQSYANITTGNIFIGGNGIYWASNGVAFVSAGSGSTPGGVNSQVQYNKSGVLAGANISYFSANITTVFTDNTASTSNTTGAAVIAGGVGIAGNLNVGGNISAYGLASTSGLILNSLTISANYTIPPGYSAISVGPITVASGTVINISSGSRWAIV
jgi:hypothetical protein